MDVNVVTCQECPHCNVVFSDQDDCNTHISNCDGTYRAETYDCGKCGISFAESHICDLHAPSCGQEELTSERSTEGSNVDTTAMVIDEMEERYEAFKKMKPAQKRKHWDDIAAATGLTAEFCRATWNKLLYSFKRIKDNGSSKKTGRGSVPRWPYFDRMSGILSGNPAVTPTHILASMPVEDDGSCPEKPASHQARSPPQDENLSPSAPVPRPSPTTPTASQSRSSKADLSTPVSSSRAPSRKMPSYMEEYLRRRSEQEEELHARRLAWGERKVKADEERVKVLKDLVNILRDGRGGNASQ